MSSSQSRRTVLRAGIATGTAALGALSVRTLVQEATAAVPNASSRAALAASTGCATLTEELTQGPFWVDEKLNRSDIRADSDTGAIRPGVLLTLTIKLQDAGASCTPQPGAFVDIWHADAQGTYSDVSGSGNPDNRGVDWLRGYQVSDDNGAVTFTTIWPGYYTSRTIHIHFRVRLTLDDDSEVNFTSQLFFDETPNTAVLSTSAYTKTRTRDTYNNTDNIYDAALLVPVTGSTTTGYTGTFTVNLDFEDGEPSTTATATPTPTPTPTATATPTTGEDTVVDARVVRATALRRGRRRGRVVRVVIDADEKVTAKVRLARHDDVLAVRAWGWHPRGRRVLQVRVPNSVAAGRARVLINLVDAAGNTKIVTKRIEVPSR